MKEKKTYNTNDLFLTTICPVKLKNLGETIVTMKKKAIKTVSLKNEEKYYDVISGRIYHLWKYCNYDYIIKNMDEYYIIELIPFDTYLKDKSEVSFEEVVDIYNRMHDGEHNRVSISYDNSNQNLVSSSKILKR